MNSRRLAYLKALDIDVWERRSLQGSRPVQADAAAVDAPRTDVAAAAQSRAAPPPVRDASTVDILASDVDAAVAQMDWNTLALTVKGCTRCALHATRTQSVFGVGNRSADWMVIGEAPGQDEDRQGEPFVGRAGQLLNSMLKAIGLAREQVFIANILKSRPPNNRDPRPEEVSACIPFLYRQIQLVDPKLILCVGRIAAQTLLQTDTPIGKLRGKLHRIAGNRPMIVTYHPAYLLRSPGEKRKSWADLVMAVQTFEKLAAGTPP